MLGPAAARAGPKDSARSTKGGHNLGRFGLKPSTRRLVARIAEARAGSKGRDRNNSKNF